MSTTDLNYGVAENAHTLGTWMLEAADISYWAVAEFEGDALHVYDQDASADRLITPEEMEAAHRDRFWHRNGVKGVHPSNYAWLGDITDYDAASTDWAVQYLLHGEVIYG